MFRCRQPLLLPHVLHVSAGCLQAIGWGGSLHGDLGLPELTGYSQVPRPGMISKAQNQLRTGASYLSVLLCKVCTCADRNWACSPDITGGTADVAVHRQHRATSCHLSLHCVNFKLLLRKQWPCSVDNDGCLGMTKAACVLTARVLFRYCQFCYLRRPGGPDTEGCARCKCNCVLALIGNRWDDERKASGRVVGLGCVR